MSATSRPLFDSVPVLDVTADNASEVLPAVRLAIANCSFVAVDCELSGLGDRRQLNASSIDERFVNVGRVAQTRAIISLGISCFRLKPQGDDESSNSDSFEAQTFNVVVLCSEDYIVEPGALRFLVEHGFDFQRQYARGVPYYRGDDRLADASANGSADGSADVEECPLRGVMSALVTSGRPLVVHNGFVDLVFLYQNLYAQLPRSLAAFVADLSQMYPAGVYDTKFLAEYVERARASYLAYLFRKDQRNNARRQKKGRRHLVLSFPKYPESCDYVVRRECPLREDGQNGVADVATCESYAHHGHCPAGGHCDKSHDIDVILDQKEGWGGGKTKAEENGEHDGEPATKKSKSSGAEPILFGGGHRAGFDAFMTGFVFAAHLCFANRLAFVRDGPSFASPSSLGAATEVNRVYLVSKDFPLLLKKSAFAKNSVGHYEKFARLNNVEKPVNGNGV